MVRIILVLAACAFANPDSLRVIQLETRLQQIEAEKVKEERQKERAQVAAMEVQVKQMAARQVSLDNQALWNAGDKIQDAIWFNLASAGCMALAQLGANDDNAGMALLGLAGGVTFEIMGIMKMYGAGQSLKHASNP